MKNTKSSEAKDFFNQKIMLDLLSFVDLDNNTTQRSLSEKLGIALGLTNTYLKRCVDKGLVKIKQVPARRYKYYLTSTGFSEKAKITREYLKSSLKFFRKARLNFEKIYSNCVLKKSYKVVLYGISDLAEVAILSSLGMNIKIIGVIGKNKEFLAGIPVYPSLDKINNFDVIIITKDKEALSSYSDLINIYGKNKVILPSLLKDF